MRLGRTQKQVLEWLKEFGGAANSWKIQSEKCDNGSQCIAPSRVFLLNT